MLILIDAIETRTVDANQWNALIFVLSSLITIFLGAIVYYARDTAKTQKEISQSIHDLALKIQHIQDNGVNIERHVNAIKEDVEAIKKEQRIHDNRITRLEVQK